MVLTDMIKTIHSSRIFKQYFTNTSRTRLSDEAVFSEPIELVKNTQTQTLHLLYLSRQGKDFDIISPEVTCIKKENDAYFVSMDSGERVVEHKIATDDLLLQNSLDIAVQTYLQQ